MVSCRTNGVRGGGHECPVPPGVSVASAAFAMADVAAYTGATVAGTVVLSPFVVFVFVGVAGVPAGAAAAAMTGFPLPAYARALSIAFGW